MTNTSYYLFKWNRLYIALTKIWKANSETTNHSFSRILKASKRVLKLLIEKKFGFWIQWVRFRGFEPWYHRWCLQWRLPPSRKAFRSESTIKGYDWSIEIRNLSQKCHNLQLTLCHELFTTCFHEKPNSQELKSQIVTNFWPIRSAFILFIRCQQLILNSKSTIFFYEIAFFSQGQKIVCFFC